MGTRHIPVVLVSNKDQAVDRIWGERQGAKGYVTKPVREAELFAAIGQALR
jgi:twitching motility two-component system response regulator PilH